MIPKTRSLRPFIGSENYQESRNFYKDLGFEEVVVADNMCVFKLDQLAFYLQDYYAAEWVNNTMLFLEVEDLDAWWKYLQSIDLPTKYVTAKLHPIRDLEWGRECFLHDPAGILWHVGEFKK